MTEKGRKIAESIETRHLVLTDLFMQLGLDPRKHHNDIEGMEHHISDPVLQKFKALILHLKRSPIA
jgi:DtxR family manganese transport transcriptional regulator